MATVADIIAGAEFPQQDYIVLGGMTSPGRATITSGAFENKWDVREPYGASGGSTVWHGNAIKHCDVTFELWTKEHFAAWIPFSRMLLAKPGKTALTIDHPALKLIQLTEVQIEKVPIFDQDEEGMWTCTVSFIEFKRPKPALSKPLQAIPNATNPKPTAQDAADLEIQKLSGQLSALAAQ